MRWVKMAGWLTLALALIFLRDAVEWGRHGLKVMPALVANLPGEEQGYSDELDAAIKSKFPVGSDERSLVDYLKMEGFAPEWRNRDALNEASFVHEGLVCRKTARVNWQADHEGMLTNVGGSFAASCQLESPFTKSGKPHGTTP